MRWAVFDSGAAATSIAQRLSLPLITIESASGADGLVIVGGDALLADVARASGPDLPLLYHPDARSDLARMFRFDQVAIESRMDSGVPYRCDLGLVASPDRVVPFVAHAVVSRSGRLAPWWARRRRLRIDRDGRMEERSVSTAVMANAQHLDANVIAPRAALMDGRGEVQFFEGSPFGRAAAQRLMERGLHLRHPAIHRRPFTELALGAPASWRLAADGRGTGPGPWRVRIEADAYSLWV